MKMLIGVVVFFWLMSGLVGAWMLDDLDGEHWQTIAKGPITLHRALDEHPVTYPSGGS